MTFLVSFCLFLHKCSIDYYQFLPHSTPLGTQLYLSSCNSVVHLRSSPIKGCLPSKVVFRQKLSSIKGQLPSKVVIHQRSSFIKGCLPSQVVFHQRFSSIVVCPSFCCIKCARKVLQCPHTISYSPNPLTS